MEMVLKKNIMTGLFIIHDSTILKKYSTEIVSIQFKYAYSSHEIE